jgi:hypothetical protein
MSRSSCPKIAALFLALSALPPCLTAQQTGNVIRGTVLNATTEEPVVGANVFVIGSTFGASSDTNGVFTISGVLPGSYEVKASAVGFASLVIQNVSLSAGEVVSFTIRLAEQAVPMSEVVTVGDQQPETPEYPLSTRYLNYREIQHTAGAFDDVIRSITMLPGVASTRIDRNDLFVRGGAPSENLYLVDGFELDNINHFGTEGAGGGTSSFLNLEFLENSSFSSGGFGVPYGDRLSSVMSLKVRDGRSDQHRVKASISATEAGLNIDGPVASGGTYLVSVRRSYLDPIFKLYGFPYTPYFWDFLGKMSFQIGKYDKVEFLTVGAIDKTRRFDETAKQRQDNDLRILGDQIKSVEGLTWNHGFDWGFTRIGATYSNTYYNYVQVGDSAHGIPHIYDATREGEVALKAEAVLLLLPTTELSIGTGVKTARLNGRLHVTIVPTGYTGLPNLIAVALASDTSGYKLFGYAQLSQTIGAFVLTAGIREDYFSMIHRKEALAPRFAITANVLSDTKLTLSYGRYNQSPSYIWLMANPYNRELDQLGMNQIVVGVEHALQNDLTVSVEAYDKKYDHYPVSLTRPYVVVANTGAELEQAAVAYTSFGLDFLQGSGTGESKGVEFFAQKRISETPLYGRLSITYGESNFTALDGVSRPSDSDQRWKISVSAGYVLNDLWEFTGSFRLATGRPYTPFGLGGWVRSSALYNTTRIGTNHSLDVRAVRRWSFGSVEMTTFIDIQNIYNKKQEQPPYWNLSTKRFEEQPSLGIVPSIGVSVEF